MLCALCDILVFYSCTVSTIKLEVCVLGGCGDIPRVGILTLADIFMFVIKVDIVFFSIYYDSATFLKNCGRGECLGTTKCARTVVGGKQGHAPCKILLPQQSIFCIS